MTEENKDPMDYIWEKVPKTAAGFIHYLSGDIPYLYQNGFVDTNRFSYKEWQQAFDDCKQADNSYLISKNKFLSLRRFRYEGPLFVPFDPYRVREGEWTDEDLKKLFERSIKPSSSITEDIFWNSVKALKDSGSLQNGKLLVDDTVKKQLAYLIERFPSPRRRLEKEVHRIREEREVELRKVSENRDSSVFVAGKLASETKLQEFKKLETASPSGASSKSDKPFKSSSEGIDIKKLRKPGRKITG